MFRPLSTLPSVLVRVSQLVLTRCRQPLLHSTPWPPAGARRVLKSAAKLSILLAAIPFVTPIGQARDSSAPTSENDRIQLQAVDAATLAPKYLLEQTTVAALEAALRTSTQALITYLRAQDDYRNSLDKYVELSEYSLLVLGNREEEERVGQAMIAVRAQTDDRHNYVLQLERLLQTVDQLVSAAVETALMLDMTFVATSGSQHHYLVQQHVNTAKATTQEKERQVREMDATAVRVVSDHHQKKEAAAKMIGANT